MFYKYPNFKFAEPLAGSDDVNTLEKEGINVLGELAKRGDIKAKACIQRLVNSCYLPEGNY